MNQSVMSVLAQGRDFLIFFFLILQGVEPKASQMLGKHLIPNPSLIPNPRTHWPSALKVKK